MPASGEVTVLRQSDQAVLIRVAGSWRLGGGLPATDALERAIDQPPPPRRIVFDSAELETWDSSLLVFVERVLGRCRLRAIEVDRLGLPEGLKRLLALAEAGPGARPPPAAKRPGALARLSERALRGVRTSAEVMHLLGELAIALVRLSTGRARLRATDLLAEIQAAGAQSLGIVTVVGFLLGMILAFVGGVTLSPFGASIYVANVVTVAMVRELGPVMTAIVMSGRTGSAYAAQLGTMKVTQELDALTTMGLSTTEFLVLPRALALSLMMPLLTVYANFVALLGGALVALVDGTAPAEYLRQSKGAITLTTFFIGLFKSAVFGVVVALCGCLQGLRTGNSAAAVGDAATRAVVTSIVWIIALDGLFAVALYVLQL